MIIDKKIKKKLLSLLVILTIGELIVVMPLFRSSVLSLQLWRSTIAVVVIIAGIALFYVILILPFGKGYNLLRSAIIANPCVVMFLAGIGVLVWDSSKFEWLFIVCSFGAVVSFIVSFVLLIRHLIVTAQLRGR